MIIGHQKQWNFLKEKFESHQLSHAYLFTGPDEIGKKTLALEFLKMIIGDLSAGKEKDLNQKLIDQGKHPDFLMVLAKNGSEIQIGQIREIQQFLNLKPYYGSLKAVVIDRAEKMNKEAQGCFLKTLEEPKGQTLLILITAKPEALLPTILSRCQTIKFFIVGLEEIKNHLLKNKLPEKKAEMLAHISDGRPGRAINLLLEPEKTEKEKQAFAEIIRVSSSDLASKFQYTKSIEESDFAATIELFKRYFRQLLFLKLGIKNFIDFGFFPPPSDKLKSYSLAKIKEIIKLAEFLDSSIATTNVNPKLALEILLMEQ